MDLPRLIAQFPGVDIGVLSSALNNGGGFEQASRIIKEMVNHTTDAGSLPDQKKARPSVSARRREQKVSLDVEERRQMDEDEKMLNNMISSDDRFKSDANIILNSGSKTLSKSEKLHKSETELNSKQSLNNIATKQINTELHSSKSHNNLTNTLHIHDDQNLLRSNPIESLHNLHHHDDESSDSEVDSMTKEIIKEAGFKIRNEGFQLKNQTKGAMSVPKQPSLLSETRSSPHPQDSEYEEDDDDDDDENDGIRSSSDPQRRHGVSITRADGSLEQQIQELFSFTALFQPEEVELIPELKCFVSDYIPAIGDIDPMIKIPAPTPHIKGQKNPIPPFNNIGLTILDEPSTKQSDPAVLDLQLRAASKGTNMITNQQVRSIQLSYSHSPSAQPGQKALAQWVQNVQDLHTHKPPDKVEYSKRMPDVERLMEEWPLSIENAINQKKIFLPSVEIDLSLSEYTGVVCNFVDIPVHHHGNHNVTKGLKSHNFIESLHVMFTLYSEFKNSQHFGTINLKSMEEWHE